MRTSTLLRTFVALKLVKVTGWLLGDYRIPVDEEILCLTDALGEITTLLPYDPLEPLIERFRAIGTSRHNADEVGAMVDSYDEAVARGQRHVTDGYWLSFRIEKWFTAATPTDGRPS